ncbi:hypothetical protein D3C71_1697850 [compost metagenome]
MQRISGFNRLPTRLRNIGAQSLESLGHRHCRRVCRRLQVPRCGRILPHGGRIRHLSDLLRGGLDLGKRPVDLGEVQSCDALRVDCVAALIDGGDPVLIGQFHTEHPGLLIEGTNALAPTIGAEHVVDRHGARLMP